MNPKIAFWKNHLDWFIPFISELYPLSKFQLIQYEDKLDWNRIAINPFIIWDEQTRACFADRLEKIEELQPSRCLLHKYDEEGYRYYIPYNYPPSEKVYLRKNEWSAVSHVSWKSITFGLFEKREYPENQIMKLIDKFACIIVPDGDPFSDLPVPTKFIEGGKDNMDWEFLSAYWALKWSFKFLKQFEKYWITEKLIRNHTAFNYCLKDDLDDNFIEEVLS